jgi:hypothetical protein
VAVVEFPSFRSLEVDFSRGIPCVEFRSSVSEEGDVEASVAGQRSRDSSTLHIRLSYFLRNLKL